MTVMRYTARKILTLLVTMLVVSLLTFAAFDMISGDPAATLLVKIFSLNSLCLSLK